eukprot:TRINITY_DN3030_c0_g3_i1.p1 TRINITY_DN3030_c0_g3~~TRINITY_DN3030_c0_g3_i1.p1  ORF type:complete len:596 (-),score=57.92 TRINITY_DN3030_c0_g3_i1:221-1942(-)
MADFLTRSTQKLSYAKDASTRPAKEMIDAYLSVRTKDVMTKARMRKEHDTMEGWSSFRRVCGRVVRNPAFDFVMLVAVLLNICAIIIEVNMEAKGQMWKTGDGINIAFITVYSLEIALRVFVERKMFFTSTMNVIELSLVSLDVLLQIVIVSLVGSLPKVSFLRVFRTLRFVRIIRTLSGFRELWLMLHGFVSAMKAIMWAILLIGIVLLLASVLSTQLLHPIAQHLSSEGHFSQSCTRCPVAFESVQSSMLTWFILVFLGDQWDPLVTPILEHHPATSALVFPIFFIIQFGMLNLILTVIVDRASIARQEDACQLLHEKQKDYGLAAQRLLTLCEAMDEDNSGCLCLSELENGFDNIDEISAMLKLMDVERDDLKTVFEILDHDRNGIVSYTEFINQLHKMKTEESHTLLVFIKHFIVDISHKVSEHMNMFKRTMQAHHERQVEEMDVLKTISLHRSRTQTRGEELSPEAPAQSLLLEGVGDVVSAQDGPLKARGSMQTMTSQRWSSSLLSDSGEPPSHSKQPGESTSSVAKSGRSSACDQTLPECVDNTYPTSSALNNQSKGKVERRVTVV